MKLSLEYAAGFFDGEGCVNFGRVRASIFPRVLIVNTNRDILEEFKSAYGGDIHAMGHRRPDWKPSWSWRLSWNRAVQFLDDISPYLRLKHDQAMTAIAWSVVAPGKGNDWDQETLDFLIERMKWLNRKGAS